MHRQKQSSIMIVDDNPTNLKLLLELLLAKGHRVVAFTNGPQALAAAVRHPPDLVLLDIRMPEMDGFEVCALIKADKALRDIPVLFISGMDEHENKIRAFALGGADYVTKPFQPEEVLARVETHLQLRHLLRESETRNFAIINAMPDMIFVLDREGRYLEVHAPEESPLPIPREQLPGKSFRDFFPAEMVDLFLESFRRAAETRQIQVVEYFLDIGGISGYYEARVTCMDEDRFLAIVRDVTDKKKAERALTQAKEKAEASSRAKSEFLNNIGHEIRTPLNGIMGMFQVLLETGLDGEQQHYVQNGIQVGRRLTGLLSDILDLSRIESGNAEIQAYKFQIRETCSGVLELFQIAAREKGIAMEIHLDPLVPAMLVGDKVRVRQILFNLIGNAVKFTETGRVSLTMSLMPVKNNGDLPVLFTVSDTGIGIEDDALSKLFHPFVQADGSYTRKYEGAGLGLVLVRRLVELMQGNISVESEPGQGSSVHVVLPFTLPEQVGEEEGR
ncbi:ATP-binding protein [Desulfonatronum parangueonense]